MSRASNNSSTAQVSLYVEVVRLVHFPLVVHHQPDKTVYFTASGTQTVKLVVETDVGTWDAYLDYITVNSGTTTTHLRQLLPAQQVVVYIFVLMMAH